MRGLKRLRSARIVAAGHAFVQNLGAGSVSAVLTVTGSPLAINTGGLACTGSVCALGPGNVGTFFYQAISQSGGTGPTPFT